ncbi:hypothetical protein [Symbiopectobacterium sp. RP]|uniref:hypothetical protein n=1 Tax=Symbiopectobacterium sp. RP TaxID=3248553 RepID=UPI003D2A3E09
MPALTGVIVKRLKNDYSQCTDMWQKIQLIVIKIMSLGYISVTKEPQMTQN